MLEFVNRRLAAISGLALRSLRGVLPTARALLCKRACMLLSGDALLECTGTLRGGHVRRRLLGPARGA
jgi:hypothetical protein